MAVRPKKLSSAEALITFLNDEMLDRRTSFPAEITDINVGATNGALISIDVQPLIRQTVSSENTDELTYRDLPIISQVPVVYPHSTVSGFAATTPIKVGDQVLVVIADRSIDNWQTTGEIANPVETVTPRAHDLTDAIAIIGISSDVKNIINYNFDKFTIRNGDGTIALEVSDSDILIKHNDINITIDNSRIQLINASSTIDIDEDSIELAVGSSKIDITGDEIKLINGDSTIDVNGNSIKLSVDFSKIDITGDEIKIESDTVKINGIDFSAHTHISNGPGNPTDPPL